VLSARGPRNKIKFDAKPKIARATFAARDLRLRVVSAKPTTRIVG
jgi:hypothetical protein